MRFLSSRSIMTSEFKRADRVAQLIQRKLATTIAQEIKDPRLPKLVTVSAVKLSSDLSYAKVYVTTLGGSSEMKPTLSILNKASGFLRSVLARTIKMRTVPELRFVYDESLEYGARLSQLINDVNPAGEDEEE